MSATVTMKKEDWEKLPGAVMCSCGNCKILYKCIDTKCPNHLAQPTYCEVCMNTKHAHFPIKKIITIIVESTVDWLSFKPRFEILAASAMTSYQKVEPLVRYLESEYVRIPAMLLTRNPHQRRNITADYQKMQATLIELSGFSERSNKMIADGLIDQLDEAKSQFSGFQEVFSSSEYLADITDDVIFEALSDTIRENHSLPFINFSQENRDQYNRLKFRSLYTDTIAQKTPLPPEQQEENKTRALESNIGIPITSILALD